MSNIQVKFVGNDAEKAQEHFEKLVKKFLGSDAIIHALGGGMQALTAVTLVLTIPVLLAGPQGILHKLGSTQQRAFLEALQKFVHAYNVELAFTLPSGRRIDVRTVSIDELHDLLSPVST